MPKLEELSLDELIQEIEKLKVEKKELIRKFEDENVKLRVANKNLDAANKDVKTLRQQISNIDIVIEAYLAVNCSEDEGAVFTDIMYCKTLRHLRSLAYQNSGNPW